MSGINIILIFILLFIIIFLIHEHLFMKMFLDRELNMISKFLDSIEKSYKK